MDVPGGSVFGKILRGVVMVVCFGLSILSVVLVDSGESIVVAPWIVLGLLFAVGVLIGVRGVE